MKKGLKKYYPKDMIFCMRGDECPMICPRKISDYEIKLLDYEVNWADFHNTLDCALKYEGAGIGEL